VLFLSDVKRRFLSIVNLFKSKPKTTMRDMASIQQYYENLYKKPPKINKKI